MASFRKSVTVNRAVPPYSSQLLNFRLSNACHHVALFNHVVERKQKVAEPILLWKKFRMNAVCHSEHQGCGEATFKIEGKERVLLRSV